MLLPGIDSEIKGSTSVRPLLHGFAASWRQNWRQAACSRRTVCSGLRDGGDTNSGTHGRRPQTEVRVDPALQVAKPSTGLALGPKIQIEAGRVRSQIGRRALSRGTNRLRACCSSDQLTTAFFAS